MSKSTLTSATIEARSGEQGRILEDEMVRAPGRRDASGQQLALFLPIAGGRKVRGWRRRRDPIRLLTVWGSLSCPPGVEVTADGQRYVKTFKPLVDRWAGHDSDGNRAFG